MTKWKNIPNDIKNYEGFVYIITNQLNKKYYIGQKKFWSIIRRKPLKGYKRPRISKVESNWQDYWGSCKDLHSDIKKYGEKNFTRMMIEHCTSKALMNYLETEHQFKHKVLFDPNCYNNIINCRISSMQLGTKKKVL